jgi:hypothetical protein
MVERASYYFLIYGTAALAILLAILALCLRGARHSKWQWWAASVLGLLFLARTAYVFQTTEEWGHDFTHFWLAGTYGLEGRDPYAVQANAPPNDDLVCFLYPPHTLPFFWPFALASHPAARVAWTVLNVFLCLSLGFMARLVLGSPGEEQSSTISPALAASLTAPVLLSLSSYFCMLEGQLSFLVTFMILGALATSRFRPDRPAVTALLLFVASVKVQTMAPFMLLFLRRKDLRLWVLLGFLGVAFMVAAGDPADLPRKFAAFFGGNAAHRAPGRPGDNSLQNPFANAMIGFEHVMYRVGVVHPQSASVLALLCTLVLGVWVAYVIRVRRTLSWGACCSLVSFYSMLFVYHRLYDLSILILPLMYSASRLRTPSRPARYCYVWIIVSILFVLNAPYGEFLRIQSLHASSIILRAVLLPSVTYLLLSAMLATVAAASFEARHHAAVPASSETRFRLSPAEASLG